MSPAVRAIRTRRPIGRLRVAALAALLLAGAPGMAGAQDTTAGQGAPQAADSVRSGEGARPGPIPIDRIPLRLEQDSDRLRRIRTELQRTEALERVRGAVAEVLTGATAILDNFEATPSGKLNERQLQNYRRSLEAEQERLNSRSERLKDWFGDLEESESTVDRLRREWILTQDSLRQDTATTPTLEVSIARVLARADSANAGIDSVLVSLLEIGDDLATTGGRIDAALGEIEDIEATQRRQLLIRDAPPLWKPAEVLASAPFLTGDPLASLRQELVAFTGSLRAERGRILLHALAYVLLLLLFLRLRRTSAEWPDEPELASARHVLSRPYSAAFLIALLATDWIYPHAAFFVMSLVLVASLVPVARLLPPLVLEDRRRAIYVLFGLVFASRFTVYLPPGSLSDRLALFLLAIATALWAASGLVATEKGEGRWIRGRWFDALVVGLRVGLGLSILSALLNAAGWVDLAEVLIQGLVPSAYFALVLALVAMVLTGLVRGLAQSPMASRSQAFTDNRDRVVGFVTLLIRIGTVLSWILATLVWFGIDREVMEPIRGALQHEFSIGEVEISIGSVLLFLFILWLATWIGRLVRTVLRDDVLTRVPIPKGQADAWSTLAQWAILLAGILFAAASAGIAGGQLAVLAGALGVGIGFGLQNIVNNFVSGFILIFEQPIKVGDKIEISSLSLLGEVRRIGIRSSTIRTFDGADVVVPNSNLIQSEVINWTLSDSKRRFQVDVGVKYGTDPQRVIDLLLEVAREHERVLKYPPPVALFTGFGDSALNFRLNMWSATFDEFFQLRSEMTVRVNDALKAEGIEIPFPQRDLHLRSVDGAAQLAQDPAASSTADRAEEFDTEP